MLGKDHLLDKFSMHEKTLVSWNLHQDKKIICNITPKLHMRAPWLENNIREHDMIWSSKSTLSSEIALCLTRQNPRFGAGMILRMEIYIKM